MLETVKGIVSSEYICSGNMKYIHILTFGHGKISVSVNQFNRGGFRYCHPTRVFCVAEFVIYTSSRGSHRLNEATGIVNYFDLCRDYDTVLLGTYFLSVAEYMMVEDQPDDEMVRLLINTLWLITHKDGLDLRLVRAAFEMRMLRLFGVGPDLSGCQLCQKPLGELYLSADDGCLFCRDCLGKHSCDRSSAEDAVEAEEILIQLESPVLDAMRYVMYAEPKKLYNFSLAEEYIPLFARACRQYFDARIDHTFPMTAMLEDITQENSQS